MDGWMDGEWMSKKWADGQIVGWMDGWKDG